MTNTSETAPRAAHGTARLRVVLLVELHDGTQQRFLEAYERVRRHAATTPGHISEQLCQSNDDPLQWLITSEWESAPSFLAWVHGDVHRQLAEPLEACARSLRPQRYTIRQQTAAPAAGRPI